MENFVECDRHAFAVSALRLPHAWIIAGIFGLSILGGIVSRTNNILAGFLLPPTLLITAAIPPLLAVS